MTATPDGYDMCPECGHHTSACVAGRCSVFVLDTDGGIGYCMCDCWKELHGRSLMEEIFSQEGDGNAQGQHK